MSEILSKTAIFLLLQVAVFLPAAVFAQQENSKAVLDNTPKRIRHNSSLVNKNLPALDQLLRLVKENSKLCSPRLTGDQSFSILRRLVKELNNFMDLQEEKPEDAPSKKTKTSYPIKKLAEEKVFYFRIDSFTPSVLEEFSKIKKNLLTKSKAPAGIVIDLRSCSGYNNDIMYKVFRCFSDSNKFFKDNKKIPGNKLSQTIVCLIGPETKGAAELFAKAVERSPNGLTVGNETSGTPFQLKYIQLDSGYFLGIPQIPAFLKKLPPKKLSAHMQHNGKYQCDFLKIKSTSKKDKCLTAALDLLTVIKEIR